MILFQKNGDYEPVAWVNGRPLHVATLLAAIHVTALVGAAFLYALRLGDWLELFKFSSNSVLHGAIWRCVTYAFVHNPTDLQSLIFFVLELGILVFFGLEVERFIGRRAFSMFYLLLILVTPATLTLHGLIDRGHDWEWVGSMTAHIGVFLAFACIYPSAEVFFLLFFRMEAKWIAWVLMGGLTVSCLAQRDWAFFAVLWAVGLSTWLYMGWVRGIITIPSLPRVAFPGIRRVPPGSGRSMPLRKKPKPAVRKSDPMAAIDPLLDKIAKGGLGSLTPEERQQLERAREELMRERR